MSRAEPGWWGRNWKWAAPSGCLLVVLLIMGGCVGIFAAVFGMMKNNEVYAGAIAAAQSNPAVIAVTGEPVNAGWMVSGNYNDAGGSGNAELSFPIEGPRGQGTLFVEARKSNGEWHYTNLTFAPEGDGANVDLLAGDGASVE